MSCRYIRRSEGGYALAFFTAHLLLYLTLRLVSLLIPEEMQLFVFMFSLFASFGLISFLHDHVTRYFGIFLLYEWSTAGFEPASSACKADVLPNELRPQSCRDRSRTCNLLITNQLRFQLRQRSMIRAVKLLRGNSRTRTCDHPVNSRTLYQLSYEPIGTNFSADQKL